MVSKDKKAKKATNDANRNNSGTPTADNTRNASYNARNANDNTR